MFMCVRTALKAFLVPVVLIVCHPRSLFHLLEIVFLNTVMRNNNITQKKSHFLSTCYIRANH